MKNILVGCEESQAVTIQLRKLGYNAFSCDLKPCSGGHPEWHLQMDVFKAIKGKHRNPGWVGNLVTQSGEGVFIAEWDAAIFFPDCTYLTCSAEWAYKEGPYHQKVKPGTLVGKERVQARADAFEFFMALWNCGIPKVIMENPVGVMSRYFRKPDHIIHPWMFGDDASKATCIWKRGLPNLIIDESKFYPPRIVNGLKRWSNQTDSGQNKLSPSDKRAELRSKTYPGIARALAELINA